MGALLALPALPAVLALPAVIITGSILFPSIFGLGIGVTIGTLCGAKNLCSRDMDNSTTLTIFNGMTTNTTNIVVYSASGPADALVFGNRLTHLTHSSENILYTFGTTAQTPQSVYITNSGLEPVCIAGAQVLYPSGTHVTVTGDLARHCEADTYESKVDLGVYPPQQQKVQQQACLWIDRNHSNGIRAAGVAVDITQPAINEGAGNNTVSSSGNGKEICDAPYLKPLNLIKPADTIQMSKQATVADDNGGNQYNFSGKLIKSHLPGSSALRMCTDKFTKGPDFVSLAEGWFCDMGTREVFPVCELDGESVEIGMCFDPEEDEVVDLTQDVDAEQGPGIREDAMVMKRALGAGRWKVETVKTFGSVNVWG